MRRLGAAAVDMCHVALGIVEAYWEYRLKPWDMAAGVLVISYPQLLMGKRVASLILWVDGHLSLNSNFLVHMSLQ